VGVINLIGRRPGLFTLDQAPILQAFASHAALALENAHQYQTTLSNLDETDSLYRALTDLLTAGGDVPQIARKIVQTVTTHLDVGHCAVALVDREKNHLSIISSSGPIKIKNSLIPLDGPGLTPLAAREGKTIYIPDVRLDPRYFKGSDETRAEFIIPLRGTNGDVCAD
jgi:GAF domain-containing protein